MVDGGRVRTFDGDLDDYGRWLASRDKVRATPAPAPSPRRLPHPPRPPSRRRPHAPLHGRPASALPYRSCGSAWSAASASWPLSPGQVAEVEARLGAPELYASADSPALRELLERQSELRRRTTQVEAEWLEASELLE